MGRPFTEDQKATIRCHVDRGVEDIPTIRAAIGARDGHVAIAKYMALHKASKDIEVDDGPEKPPESERVEEFEEKGDIARVSCIVGADGVVTEDDLVRVCKIDPTRWRIRSLKFKAYQTGMKVGTRELDGKGTPRIVRETPHVVQLFSVSAELERVLPKPFLDAADALYGRLSAGMPDFGPAPATAQNPYIATMGLFDVHFAKLCWGRETGRGDYDLRLAELIYRNAGHDLLGKLSPYPIKRFLLPVGNDLFHVDTAKGTTTAGTVVDTDGRYFKMIEVGTASVLWLIELLHRVAPVDVFYVPGNHDRLSSYHLCREIMRAFSGTAGVAVEIDPNIRKYRRYGCNLFGYRHGDKVSESKVAELPGVMADEAPRDWGDTTCRAWFLGHKHTSRRYTTRESDEIRGTRIHWLSALSGTDAWHHEEGYVGNTQAAEAYIHSEDDGYAGHFVAKARA